MSARIWICRKTTPPFQSFLVNPKKTNRSGERRACRALAYCLSVTAADWFWKMCETQKLCSAFQSPLIAALGAAFLEREGIRARYGRARPLRFLFGEEIVDVAGSVKNPNHVDAVFMRQIKEEIVLEAFHRNLAKALQSRNA